MFVSVINIKLKVFLFDWTYNELNFLRSKKIIYFGAAGCLKDRILEMIPSKENSYFVDNDTSKWGQVIDGCVVYNPRRLLNEKKGNLAIIVASIKYSEIKLQLESYGYHENINFFDARALLAGCEGGYTYNLLLRLDRSLCMR